MSAIINTKIEEEKTATANEKLRVASAFAKSALCYDGVADLQRQVGSKLIQMLDENIGSSYLNEQSNVLDLGSGTGYFSEIISEKWPVDLLSLDIAMGMLTYARDNRFLGGEKTFVCADAEKLPLQKNKFELVFSNFALQWCDDLESVFIQINEALKPGGYFVFSLPVEGTLSELKSSWQTVDSYRHVNEFYDFKTIQGISENVFQHTGIKNLYCQDHIVYYPQVRSLMKALKALGANQVKTSHQKQIQKNKASSLMGRGDLQKLISAYDQYRNEQGKLPATYRVVSGLIRKQ